MSHRNNITSRVGPKPKDSHNVNGPSTALEPPRYYDSEPSSQPPYYNKDRGKGSNRTKNEDHSSVAYTYGASAASVAAVMAPPPKAISEEDKRKRPWVERWRAWKTRNWKVWRNDEYVWGTWGQSSGEWNYMGVRLKDHSSMVRQSGKRQR